MKVKELKKMLEGVDDEMDVLIPMTPEFDGYFKQPCVAESGVSELGVNENLGTTERKLFASASWFL